LARSAEIDSANENAFWCSCARLRHSPSFHRLTGVRVAVFDQMLKQLHGPWQKAQSRKGKSGQPLAVDGLDEHLLILLLYYRCYL
jgi:hypothetical protein